MLRKLRIPVVAAALTLPLIGSAAYAQESADNLAARPMDVGVSTVAAEITGERTGEELTRNDTVLYTSPRTVISYPGAAYVKVHVNAMKLAAGDRLVVSDPAGRERHVYTADPSRSARPSSDSSATFHRTQGFGAMSIDGDTAVVTIEKTSRASARSLDRAGHGVRIDRVWRGLTDAERLADQTRAVCGRDARQDAICYAQSHPTHYARSKATAKIIMNGSGSCTAWRVGNTNRMLTNNHCIKAANAVRTTEVQFGYDCATCGRNDPVTPTKVSGAEFFKTNATLDYTLFSMDRFEAVTSFGTIYLDPRIPVAGEEIYIPGHGDGKPKRISIVEEPGAPQTCTVYKVSGNRTSYNCDTSGGNSGSPVLSATSHKAISLHNTGRCPNDNGSNRIDKIYPEIQSMIDNRIR
ncbi:serine protease [Pilimelia columellifera]|uniref:Serine protease n=1 Tax=Pilimelia columellifera subsp. columellifera TaxID=706583 RepID=A0ABP6AYT3_9ACTN